MLWAEFEFEISYYTLRVSYSTWTTCTSTEIILDSDNIVELLISEGF